MSGHCSAPFFLSFGLSYPQTSCHPFDSKYKLLNLTSLTYENTLSEEFKSENEKFTQAYFFNALLRELTEKTMVAAKG